MSKSKSKKDMFSGKKPAPLTKKEIENMECLKCGHKWERTKWTEYISFLPKCPKCGSRLIVRY